MNLRRSQELHHAPETSRVPHLATLGGQMVELRRDKLMNTKYAFTYCEGRTISHQPLITSLSWILYLFVESIYYHHLSLHVIQI